MVMRFPRTLLWVCGIQDGQWRPPGIEHRHLVGFLSEDRPSKYPTCRKRPCDCGDRLGRCRLTWDGGSRPEVPAGDPNFPSASRVTDTPLASLYPFKTSSRPERISIQCAATSSKSVSGGGNNDGVPSS